MNDRAAPQVDAPGSIPRFQGRSPLGPLKKLEYSISLLIDNRGIFAVRSGHHPSWPLSFERRSSRCDNNDEHDGTHRLIAAQIKRTHGCGEGKHPLNRTWKKWTALRAADSEPGNRTDVRARFASQADKARSFCPVLVTRLWRESRACSGRRTVPIDRVPRKNHTGRGRGGAAFTSFTSKRKSLNRITFRQP